MGLSSFCVAHTGANLLISWGSTKKFQNGCYVWHEIIFSPKNIIRTDSDRACEFIPNFRLNVYVLLNALFVLFLTDRLWCTHVAFFFLVLAYNRNTHFVERQKRNVGAIKLRWLTRLWHGNRKMVWAINNNTIVDRYTKVDRQVRERIERKNI